MILRTRSIVVIAAAGIAVAAAVEVKAGGEKIVFPEDYAKGVVYMTIDRAQNKQTTDYYVSREAIDAAKAGTPLPSGTVITAVAYAAQLDAEGNPVKDAKGTFVKSNAIEGYRTMAKRAGWGSEYPENIRNGEWEYQVFRADKSVNPAANLAACFECHKPQASQDYVFTYDKIRAAAR